MKRVNDYIKITQLPYLSPLCEILIQTTSGMYMIPIVFEAALQR